MNTSYTPDPELERRLSGRLMDVFIRAGFVFAMVVLCYQIFSPFLALMVWALILAVVLYPAHQKLARKMGGKQGLAATVMVLIGLVLIGVPATVLMFELGDSVHHFVGSVRDHTLQIPAPSPGIADWPIVGKKLFGFWSQAHTDLPAVVQSLQPKLGDFAKSALAFVASTGVATLLFLASFIIAGIIMAFGESGASKYAGDFRSHRRHWPRRRICQAVHGDDSRRGIGCARGGLYPGHRRRLVLADRRRSVCGSAGVGRAGTRNRAGSGAAGHAAGHRLYLDER